MNTNSINITQNANVYGNNIGNSTPDPAPDPTPIGSFIIAYLNFQNLAFTALSNDTLRLNNRSSSLNPQQIFNFSTISTSGGLTTVNVQSSTNPGYYLGRSNQGNPNSPVTLIQSSTGVGSNIEWLVQTGTLQAGLPTMLIDPQTDSIILPVNGSFISNQPLTLAPQTPSSQPLILLAP